MVGSVDGDQDNAARLQLVAFATTFAGTLGAVLSAPARTVRGARSAESRIAGAAPKTGRRCLGAGAIYLVEGLEGVELLGDATELVPPKEPSAEFSTIFNNHTLILRAPKVSPRSKIHFPRSPIPR